MSAYENASARDRIDSVVPTPLPAPSTRPSCILPGPDYRGAAERDAECYYRTISRSIEQAVFVLGDFNSCDITSLLPDLYQSVTCPTRLNKTKGTIKSFESLNSTSAVKNDMCVCDVLLFPPYITIYY